MKKILRFFIATRRFSLLDVWAILGFVALLNADHIVWAFVALIVGAVVSLIAEKAAL
jgi:hypothetical protein